MINGTSDLNNIGLTNIFTPKIKVLLRENRYKYELPQYISGTSQQDITYGSGIKFGNNYYIHEFSGGPSQASQILTVGVSTRVTTLGASPYIYDVLASGFYTNGNSLYFFYTDDAAVRRLGFNGSNWGGTITVWNAGGTPIISEIGVVNENKVYVVAGISHNEVYSVINQGATQIMQYPRYINSFEADAVGTVDRMVFISSETIDSSRANFSLDVVTTDGYNTFGRKQIYDKTPSAGQVGNISMGNLTKGATYYYMMTKVNTFIFDNNSHALISSSSDFYLNTSDDMLNWQVLKLPALEFGNILSSRVLLAHNGASEPIEVVSIGATPNPSYQGPLIEIRQSKDQLDVSANLVNYNNINNERINLTLGNYGNN